MQLTDQARGTCLVVFRALAIVLIVPMALSGCQSHDRASAGLPTTYEASTMLGLRWCEVVQRTVDPVPGQEISVTIPLDGQDYRIDLKPDSVRAAGYRVLVQEADGSVTARRGGPVRTLRGTVRGRPGCRVAGSVLSDGLHMVILLEDGRRCWMEPLPGGAPHTYAVYDQRHILSPGGVCRTPGADAADAVDEDDQDNEPSSAASPTSVFVAQIACDTDTEYVAAQGSVSATEARINAIINAINVQFESQAGIRHEITSIVIRRGSDPYTASDAQDRLCQFIQEWTSNRTDVDRDVAHLFTGANLRGGTIGIAADIGGTGICVTDGGCRGGQFGAFGSYCLAQSDFSSSFSCATDITAHELGHLWGAVHCNCVTSTMNPGITCSNRFSAGTVRSIIRYRDTRGCLERAAADTGS